MYNKKCSRNTSYMYVVYRIDEGVKSYVVKI